MAENGNPRGDFNRGRGVQGTIRDLRGARRELVEKVPAGARAVGDAVQAATSAATNLIRLLEAAEGHLDELYGDAFLGYWCHRCGLMVSDAILLESFQHSRALSSRLTAYEARGGGIDREQGVTCWGPRDEQHEPCAMRWVVCRVTADSPESVMNRPAGG